MLPLLLDADPAQATNVRLVSLARAFVAGCELVSSVAPAGNSVRRKPSATELTACSGCCLNALNTSPIQRSVAGWYMPCIRLPAKRYFPPICGRKTVVTGLRTHLSGILWAVSVPGRGNSLFQQTGICMCAADLLYPAPAADDEYLLFLKRQLVGWTSALDADGCWPGCRPGRVGTHWGDEPGCLDVSRLGERYRDKAGGGVLPQVRTRPCRPPEFRRGGTSVRWGGCTRSHCRAMPSLSINPQCGGSPGSCTITA